MKLALVALPVLVAFGSAAWAANEGGESIPAACSPDVQKFCASASNDEAKVECLAQNEGQLSQACRAAIDGSSQASGQQGQPSGY
jgi:hypothetical protein